MSTYTVVSSSVKKTLPDTGKGAKQVIGLVLKDAAGEKDAEWFTNASTELPAAGSSLEGDVTWNDQFKRWSFKKAGGPGGGGGFRRDPRVERTVQRQSERNSAIALLAQSKTLEGFDFLAASDEEIKLVLRLVYRLSDAFSKDSEKAADLPAAQASYGQRRDVERTGVSDVPAPAPEEFQHPEPVGVPADQVPF